MDLRRKRYAILVNCACGAIWLAEPKSHKGPHEIAVLGISMDHIFCGLSPTSNHLLPWEGRRQHWGERRDRPWGARPRLWGGEGPTAALQGPWQGREHGQLATAMAMACAVDRRTHREKKKGGEGERGRKERREVAVAGARGWGKGRGAVGRGGAATTWQKTKKKNEEQ
jgi:hypothetical protein